MTQRLGIGTASGGVRWLLRLEGLVMLVFALLFYHQINQTWSHFVTWFLVPDVALLAYLINARVGAWAYNFTHSTILPWALLTYSFLLAQYWLSPYGVIWLAHIGFDRALGYGLKYEQGFGFTHLGRIGRARRALPDMENADE